MTIHYTRAKARHILVETESHCLALQQKIQSLDEFDTLARSESLCPSGRVGGDLGLIKPGVMVPEFEDAVFKACLNTLIGPIKTKFGFHLIWVTALK